MLENNQNVFSFKNSKTSFFLGLIFGILILATIGFFILLGIMLSGNSSESAKEVGGSAKPPTAQVQTPTALPGGRLDIKVTENDHIRGDINAPVKIIEFSDYQCPFCQKHHSTMQQITEEYGEQVAWVYKHFPLDSIHQNARPAAEASECVWEQKGDEGFWQFTDKLFENQSSLGLTLYNQLAQEIGVDMSQFDECVSSRKYQQKVEADYQTGIKAGVNGTPANFVNGLSISGAAPYSNFKQVIDSELSK